MLIDDRLALLAPARSRWAGRSAVRLAELADESLILFLSSYMLNERILDACRQLGFTPAIAGRSGQIGFILELVRSGVGIALLPSSELRDLVPQAFAVAALIEPEIPWRIDLACSRRCSCWIERLRTRHDAGAMPSTGMRQAQPCSARS